MTAETEHKLREKIKELLSIPSENRQQQLIVEINALSPDPSWSDYIYQSDDYLDDEQNVDLDRFMNRLKENTSIRL